MWIQLNDCLRSLATRLQVKREEGQALVEYTLISALVSVVCNHGSPSMLGTDIKTKLEAVVAAL